MKRILGKFLYLFFKILLKVITLTYFKLKVEGVGNLPEKGPFIVVANHTSFLDPVVIQMSLPVNISWITRKDVYNKRYLRIIHSLTNSIPVNGSTEKALKALEEGRVVGIFPEGTRSKDGKLKETRNVDVGIAVLALRSGKTILPVGIKGAFEAFGPTSKFPRPYPVTVKIGRPLSFQKDDRDIIERDVLAHMRDRIMNKLRGLLT